MADRVMAKRRHVFEGTAGPGYEFDPVARQTCALRLAQPASRWCLRFSADDARARRLVAGFDVAQPINALGETAADGGAGPDAQLVDRLSARLGPDEWLLIGGGEEADAIAAQLAADLEGAVHALVDISHRHIAIDVAGPHAADVINTGCPLDLGSSAFPSGSATRTLFGKIEIILMRRADDRGVAHYRIECGRSFGRYLHAHLVQSMALLGGGGLGR